MLHAPVSAEHTLLRRQDPLFCFRRARPKTTNLATAITYCGVPTPSQARIEMQRGERLAGSANGFAFTELVPANRPA
jgi:hypothetical protein